MLVGDECIARAAEFAKAAHVGQKYGDGTYFDEHLVPVAELSQRLGYNWVVQAGGLLHDTVEDTPTTREILLAEGFPGLVVNGVMAVTYLEDGGETEEKVDKARANLVGHVIKLCDTQIHISNLSNPEFVIWNREILTPEVRMRQLLKYHNRSSRLFLGLPTPQDIQTETDEGLALHKAVHR